jgi:lactoylglutathione lyase
MGIEHVALYTTDLERMRNFYVRYFNGQANEKYRNPRTSFESYFITFDSGARLELMQKPGIALRPAGEAGWTGWAHMAVSVGSREKVDELTQVLREAGYPVLSGPRVTGDGYYESVVADPDGNSLEITV